MRLILRQTNYLYIPWLACMGRDSHAVLSICYAVLTERFKRLEHWTSDVRKLSGPTSATVEG